MAMDMNLDELAAERIQCVAGQGLRRNHRRLGDASALLAALLTTAEHYGVDPEWLAVSTDLPRIALVSARNFDIRRPE